MVKIRRYSSVLTLLLCLVSCGNVQKKADYQVVPLPKSIELTKASPFVLNNSTKIVYPEGNEKMLKNAQFLAEYIKEVLGKDLTVLAGDNGDDAIVLKLSEVSENEEGYVVDVFEKQIVISSPTEAGVFYGIQTVRKSLPLEKCDVEFPAVLIKDAPRFAYRGMMLDVSRHFFPISFVKKYIDILALHNINHFHWHLSEDQGWRIEIKKYPKLTEIGSKRAETVIGRNSGKYDGIPYEGFYTQEEAKEVVAYAAERYITVIPEIDMPGHMLAALASYPELGCTGGPYEVWTKWGISDQVLCAGNDLTLEFLEGVLEEIVEIFPSEYIHIGGDECPKTQWKTCPKCQERVRKEKLFATAEATAEDRLQGFVMAHAAKVVEKHGRKIIGWDEILQGDIAENATVMSWRGTEGGIKAAKMGHDVIMAPHQHAYFDYYQTDDQENEPLAIGGFLPLWKVYEFDPVPSVLAEDQKKHILGMQANLWTEYIPTEEQVEYMLLPRIGALAENQWREPETKNYEEFLPRLARLIQYYEFKGLNYAKHLFNVESSVKSDFEAKHIEVVLTTLGDAPIYYTLDGTNPSASSLRYEEPILINKTTTLKAIAIRDGFGESNLLTDEFVVNKATFKSIEGKSALTDRFTNGGYQSLLDGVKGKNNYLTDRWIGTSNSIDFILDLQAEEEISSLAFDVCVDSQAWVFDSRGVEVSVSLDGENFTPIYSEEYPAMKESDAGGIYPHKASFDPIKARFLSVSIKSERNIPEWHGGKGKAGFVFVDEIEVQ